MAEPHFSLLCRLRINSENQLRWFSLLSQPQPSFAGLERKIWILLRFAAPDAAQLRWAAAHDANGENRLGSSGEPLENLRSTARDVFENSGKFGISEPKNQPLRVVDRIIPILLCSVDSTVLRSPY